MIETSARFTFRKLTKAAEPNINNIQYKMLLLNVSNLAKNVLTSILTEACVV